MTREQEQTLRVERVDYFIRRLDTLISERDCRKQLGQYQILRDELSDWKAMLDRE